MRPSTWRNLLGHTDTTLNTTDLTLNNTTYSAAINPWLDRMPAVMSSQFKMLIVDPAGNDAVTYAHMLSVVSRYSPSRLANERWATVVDPESDSHMINLRYGDCHCEVDMGALGGSRRLWTAAMQWIDQHLSRKICLVCLQFQEVPTEVLTNWVTYCDDRPMILVSTSTAFIPDSLLCRYALLRIGPIINSGLMTIHNTQTLKTMQTPEPMGEPMVARLVEWAVCSDMAELSTGTTKTNDWSQHRLKELVHQLCTSVLPLPPIITRVWMRLAQQILLPQTSTGQKQTAEQDQKQTAEQEQTQEHKASIMFMKEVSQQLPQWMHHLQNNMHRTVHLEYIFWSISNCYHKHRRKQA
jgi:hypothetical protein